MYIIKLNAIDSTNTYLKDMSTATLPMDYTVVIAELQTKGRGQMGAKWRAESGKNLTASVFKRLSFFNVTDQFYISMAVSLAIIKALRSFKIPQLRIKWPNDILSADTKLCGILIENVIKNNNLQGSIIGFGLNVNQKFFDNLPQASSMSLVTGVIFNKDEVLSEVLKQLKVHFDLLESKQFLEIKSEYEDLLFRKNKPSTFRTSKNDSFSGIIQGVTENGQLQVWTEDGIIKTFDLKEIKLLY
ncbi:biotin--[acetyl-CoA-carboxylase] ligase [Winogradskyella thalassocola]|uniref:BirA family transcriptional regulator, biotin operon repressor / biotin-[acetyl-CoA-carboxylase] ligase n=1 Tax=Winogradskyella thalassocola TaxID=262004 RepID=A0A1G8I6Z4_9FLAO|nr:biotin--[acetyl-CoA-carboxylase] ligase [Winogradskyella thalassocola]SDI14607.1 BirA family transcriptional regulator, biotin operon repressor / biotin-[acetyl-CoA-carboxylase] ligase [Winogradskyella thalassocola]